jgi:hypothetical protein
VTSAIGHPADSFTRSGHPRQISPPAAWELPIGVQNDRKVTATWTAGRFRPSLARPALERIPHACSQRGPGLTMSSAAAGTTTSQPVWSLSSVSALT